MKTALRLALALFLACLAAPPALAADELLENEQAFRFSARLKDPRTVEVHYDIAKGYYMYRDNFRFAVEGAQLGQAKTPPGKKKFDINFQKTMETYRGAVTILLPVEGTGSSITVKSTSQGCADQGVCYPPITQSAVLSRPGASAAPAGPGAAPAVLAKSKPAHAAGFTRIDTSNELDATLKSANRVALLDFYADWCGPCKQMERLTFSDPRVRQKLASFAALQADVTRNNEEDRALLKRFKLVGPPGIVFFDKSGRELTALRVVGYQPPEKFLQTLEQATQQ